VVTYISIADFLSLRDRLLPVLDVRSPGEYVQGHIPQAVPFPLFSNEERKIVGTLFKESGPEKAFLAGLDFAGRKMSEYVRNAASLHSHELLLYCWRGGKRSESMAWLLSQAGYTCYVLEGGYRAYRRYLHETLDKNRPVLVLGGMTGSNKTGMLLALKKSGHQVIDLEGLACHKGSAFGHINEPQQPTTEFFENLLFDQWRILDPFRPVWLEDESRSIGKVILPQQFYNNKRMAPLLVITVPLKQRVMHLVDDYTGVENDKLKDAVMRISKRLGSNRVNASLLALKNNDFFTVAEIVLEYYDKAYRYAISQHNGDSVFYLSLPDTNASSGAEKIAEWYREYFQKAQ